MSHTPQIVLHTAPGCGSCYRARALLDRHEVPFDEVSGNMDRDGRDTLEAATGGRTFPQVIVDGEAVGGYRQLRAIARSGALGDPPQSGPGLREVVAFATPCNLIYGAIAVATMIAVLARLAL
jgi:glutaredoxin 3